MPSHEDVRLWYDQRYYTAQHGGSGDGVDPSVDYFYPRLGLGDPCRVLDVACGEGGFLARAARDGHQVAGVDISDVAIERARRRLPDADLLCSTAEQLPFDDRSFDVVTCFGALEHFLDIPAALAEMRRVAAGEARFYFVVPNRWYLGWWLKREPGTCQQDIQEKLCSRREWTRLFAVAGLQVERVLPDRRPCERWWIAQSGGAVRKASRSVKAVMLRVSPLNWQYQFLFQLRATS